MSYKFENKPDNSRVWVYQASRALKPEESSFIFKEGSKFMATWAYHGALLRSDLKTIHKHFLVLCVDESIQTAGGCSIDSSVHFVKELEMQFSINFLDRTRLAFLIENEIIQYSASDLQTLISEGVITPNSLYFNNLIDKNAQLDTHWLITSDKSWFKNEFQIAKI